MAPTHGFSLGIYLNMKIKKALIEFFIKCRYNVNLFTFLIVQNVFNIGFAG